MARALLFPSLILAAISAAASCRGAGDGDADALALRITVDSSAGYRQVRSAGAPPRWRLDSTVVVREAGGRPFGRLAGVVGDWRGGIYVADADSRTIHRFDARGEFLGSMGGQGTRPGQFRQLSGLAWVGGRLASLDAGSGRVVLLAADGEGAPASIPWDPPAGRAALEQTRPGEAYAPLGLRGAGNSMGPSYIRLLGTGVPDTLTGAARAPGSTADEDAAITCAAPGGDVTFDVPFAPASFTARAPDMRSVVGHTARYRLALVGPGGDTLRLIERELPAVPVSDEEWAEVERSWAGFMEAHPDALCHGASPRRPASKPAFRDVFWDDGGRLWVEAFAPAGFRFDLFDSTGVLVGELPAPVRDPDIPVAIRSGWLYWVSHDSSGTGGVHAARIEEAPVARAGAARGPG